MMIRYDKMYYALFNAITDALEIAKALPPSAESDRLQSVLCAAQQSGEDIYLLSEAAGLTEMPKGGAGRKTF